MSEHAEVRLNESVSVDGAGTLYVDVDFGAVRVESHDKREVCVEASASGPAADRVEFDLAHEGDDVTLDARCDQGGLCAAKVRAVVRVPRDYSVDVHTGAGSVRVRAIDGRVAVDCAAGAIQVRDVGGSVLVRAGGGAIDLRDVRGPVRARTTGGAIRAKRLGDAAEVRTGAGAIVLRDVTGPLDARSSAGPIHASFDRAPSGEVRTSLGPITVGLAPDACVELDASAQMGSVRVHEALPFDGVRTGSSVRGRVGAGGASLVLRTNMGTIDVRGRPDEDAADA